MNIKDYASDVGKTVDEIIALCDNLGIKYEDEETILNDEDIIVLDNNLTPDDEEASNDTEEETFDEEVEDKAEELAQNTKYDLDNNQKFEKVKKKVVGKENKTNFLKERKKIYLSTAGVPVFSQPRVEWTAYRGIRTAWGLVVSTQSLVFDPHFLVH